MLALTPGIGFAAAAPDPLEGHWEGAYSRMGSVQLVSFDFSRASGDLRGTFSVPECDVFDEPVQGLADSLPRLVLRARYGRFVMHLSPDSLELTGLNAGWNPPLLLHLKRAPARPRAVPPSEPLSFRSSGVALQGTLMRPASPGRHAAVVVVHGSGPQRRGDSHYRWWGEFLAGHGVAALLYDKRGSDSPESFREPAFADLAADARAAVAALRAHPAVDGARIGLLGMSQGGWIAPLAASDDPAVRFLMLDVGPAVTVAEQELDRVRNELADQGATAADVERALDYTRAVFHTAYTGRDRGRLDSLTAAARGQPWASVVQLVESTADLDDWRTIRYDPGPVLRRTRIPLLARFGELDPLVPPAGNRDRMERWLREAGNRDATVRIIPGVGHDMTTFGTLRGGAWRWPESHWVWPRRPPEFHATIVQWLEAHGLTRPTLQ